MDDEIPPIDSNNTPAQMIELREQGAVFVADSSATDYHFDPYLPLKCVEMYIFLKVDINFHITRGVLEEAHQPTHPYQTERRPPIAHSITARQEEAQTAWSEEVTLTIRSVQAVNILNSFHRLFKHGRPRQQRSMNS